MQWIRHNPILIKQKLLFLRHGRRRAEKQPFTWQDPGIHFETTGMALRLGRDGCVGEN